MKLKQLKPYFFAKLKTIYPKTETESFFYILIEHLLGLKRIDLAFQQDLIIKPDSLDQFTSAIEQLKKEVPVQYITGETEFYELHLKVDKNVLIPRPETEELVDWIIKGVESRRLEFEGQGAKLKILDIGTGSGCIAIALAKYLPNAEVSAIDISEKALKIAEKNALVNQLTIRFIQKDILQTKHLDRDYDIIVSNPPYVKHSEKELMKNNVLDHEPHMALFVEDKDSLIFYRHISSLAKQQLTKNGSLYFEINQAYGKEIRKLLENQGFTNTEIKKDIFGTDRMVKGVNK